MELFTPITKFDKNRFLKIDSSNKIIASAEEEKFTYLHIKYFATHDSEGGFSWVNMNTESYIYKNEAKVFLKLLYAINVPILPERHFFYSLNESLDFTLIFPYIPKSWDTFNFGINEGEQLYISEKGFEKSEHIHINNIKRNNTGVYRLEIKN